MHYLPFNYRNNIFPIKCGKAYFNARASIYRKLAELVILRAESWFSTHLKFSRTTVGKSTFRTKNDTFSFLGTVSEINWNWFSSRWIFKPTIEFSKINFIKELFFVFCRRFKSKECSFIGCQRNSNRLLQLHGPRKTFVRLQCLANAGRLECYFVDTFHNFESHIR